MALRNQPYLPFYVQDFLTDEKLIECSASATGVYIRIMCIMHKSEQYGTILLRQNDKQTEQQDKNFAIKLAKHLPYSAEVILAGLQELLEFKVLKIEGDLLIQKRMVNDNLLSEKRAEAGKKGGEKTKSKFAIANLVAKEEANSENETEIENNNKGGVSEKFDTKLTGFFSHESVVNYTLRDEIYIEDAMRQLLAKHPSLNKTKFLEYVAGRLDLMKTDGSSSKYPLGTIRRILITDYDKHAKNGTSVKTEQAPTFVRYKP